MLNYYVLVILANSKWSLDFYKSMLFSAKFVEETYESNLDEDEDEKKERKRRWSKKLKPLKMSKDRESCQ
jgi:hypothetical protein